MGLVRTIQASDSLDTIWEELVYSEARFLGDPLTRDLAEPHAALLTTLDAVRVKQRAAWRDEIIAQAGIDAVNITLDSLTTDFGARLLSVVRGNRASPRWRRYFPGAVFEIVRLALGRQVAAVRGWPNSLRGEPEAEIKPFGDRFETVTKQADAALQARIDAASRRNDHRVREVLALIDDVNAARTSALGRLLQRAVKNDLPREWAEGFFRRSQRRASAATEDDGPDAGGDTPTG